MRRSPNSSHQISDEKKWSIYVFRLHGWQDREIAPVVGCCEKTVYRYRSFYFRLPPTRLRKPITPLSVTQTQTLIKLNKYGFNDGDIAEVLDLPKHIVSMKRVRLRLRASTAIFSEMTINRELETRFCRHRQKRSSHVADVQKVS